MLTGLSRGREHGHMSSVTTVLPVGRAPQRRGFPTAAPSCALPPRQLGLTKRRVIDLMRVGRTFCCR